MAGRETSQICRIMRDDQAAAEPDSGSHHERIHSHIAPAPRPGEKVPATRAIRTPVVTTRTNPRPNT